MECQDKMSPLTTGERIELSCFSRSNWQSEIGLRLILTDVDHVQGLNDKSLLSTVVESLNGQQWIHFCLSASYTCQIYPLIPCFTIFCVLIYRHDPYKCSASSWLRRV